MKHLLILSKQFLYVLSIQCFLCLGLAAQGEGLGVPASEFSGLLPIKNNWIGMSGMSLSSSGNVCVIPYLGPDGMGGFDYYFILRTIIFLSSDDLDSYSPPLYLYYNLPNGESSIVQIKEDFISPMEYLGPITPALAAEFGEMPDVDYCAVLIHMVCMPECTAYEGCGEFSTQLLEFDNGWKGYPIGNDQYPIGNGLFPSGIFQSDEYGRSFHYTEFKEICCQEGSLPSNPPTEDPCEGRGGSTWITDPPLGGQYPLNDSPCSERPWGLVQNQTSTHAAVGVRLEQKKQSAVTADLPSIPASTVDEAFLFPNPSSTSITIQYTGEPAGDVIFDCLDVQGRLMVTKVLSFPDMAGRTDIDISTFMPGVYFVKVSTSESTRILRFVKSDH